jgi:NADH-quinone oxidoreductase subunit H
LQQKVLVAVAVGLIAVGGLFAIPAVNAAAMSVFWFLFKISIIIYVLIWFRGTFPRFRYDQLMDIGWKYMIPIGMASLVVNALLGMIHA